MQDQDDIWPEVPDYKSDKDALSMERPGGLAPPSGADEPEAELSNLEVAAAFRKDLLRLAVPIRSVQEAGTFIAVLLLFFAVPFVDLFAVFCCLMIFIWIGIWGCLASFFFNLLTDTADGEDHLPYLSSLFTTLLEDFWQGVIIPITNFYAAVFYAFLPCLAVSAIYYLATGSKTALADWPPLLFIILLAIGAFMTPMVMLALARNKLQLLFKPHKILRSIGDVWKPYLVCWLCLLAAVGLAIGAYFLIKPFTGKTFSTTWLILTLAASVIDICVWIYAMRVIGLLWRHYQHRLGWDPDIEHLPIGSYKR